MTARIASFWLLIATLAFSSLHGARAQSIQTTVPIVYLYDVGTKSVLFEKGADELFPPASIIKLLTAETVFDALKQGQVAMETEYLISEQTWRRGGAPSGGAAMFAALNSRVAVSDLLQGLLVMSANDAALALAEGLSGSEAEFLKRMQGRASALDLTRSQFRNATGFSHPEQRVTARDIAKLAGHIIQTYPEYYSIFGQREFTWNKIRQLNRNPLLTMNLGADGMKTGNIAEAGFGLVGSAVQDDRRLILVILGADSAVTRSAEAKKLLEWGFRNFERRKLLEKGVVLAEAKVTGGTSASVNLGVRDNIDMLLPKSSLDTVSTKIIYLGPIKAPVSAGTELGRLIVNRGTTVALEVPIVALSTVQEGSLGKRAFDNSWDWVSSLFRRSGSKT
jgi:serine-type D-Ala-D-Ala carboxypeptidase (penicillin-binding protein 5/6)